MPGHALPCTAQPPPAGGGKAMGTDFFETSAMLVTLDLLESILSQTLTMLPLWHDLPPY